jgi:hypothetical protein
MEMKKYLRNNMTLFDKVEWLKRLSSEAIGVSDEALLRGMLRRLSRKGSGSINKYGVLRFSQQELVLDQLLKSSEVSPRSAYRWFSLLKAPIEAHELGRCGKLSQNQIEKQYSKVLRKSDPEQDKLGKEILQDIIKVVEGM